MVFTAVHFPVKLYYDFHYVEPWNLVRFTGQITDKPIEFDYIA